MISNISQLVQSGQWAALAFVLLTLVSTWLSPDSKFPIVMPEWLRAVVTIVLGQALGVLASYLAGQAWHAAAVTAGLASLVAIAASHAVWNGKATPRWMQILAGIAQGLLTKGAVSDDTRLSSKPTIPPIGPVAGIMAFVCLISMTFAVPVFCQGCTKAQVQTVVTDLTPTGACVLSAVESGVTDPLVVLAQCAPVTIEGIIQIVETFLSATTLDAGDAVALKSVRMHSFLTQAYALKGAK